MSAVNQRLQAKPTASKPELDGWIEKGGRFSLAASSKVANRFTRKTRLHAEAERESGVTIIRGGVSDGVTRGGQAAIFGVLLVLGFVLLSGGNAMLAALVIVLGAALYVPLRGDAENSKVLMKELRRTLEAKDKPPRKPSQKSSQPKSPTRRSSTSTTRSRSTRTRQSR